MFGSNDWIMYSVQLDGSCVEFTWLVHVVDPHGAIVGSMYWFTWLVHVDGCVPGSTCWINVVTSCSCGSIG